MRESGLAKAIEEAAKMIREANYAVALTGAGISTPSGIPDFRSPQTGLWMRDNPMEVASWSAFRYHPQKFFNWLHPLAEKSWYAQPNPAHYALAQMERAGLIRSVITQNIDGLHQKAGSINVIEVHGSLRTLSCLNCRRHFETQAFIEPFLKDKQLPRCPNCRAILKPDIVLFEELLPTDAWERAQAACENADLILVIGSSLEVMPAASLPLYTLEHGGKLIINTLSPTYLDHEAALLLRQDVTEVMPKIAELALAAPYEGKSSNIS